MMYHEDGGQLFDFKKTQEELRQYRIWNQFVKVPDDDDPEEYGSMYVRPKLESCMRRKRLAEGKEAHESKEIKEEVERLMTERKTGKTLEVKEEEEIEPDDDASNFILRY